MAISKERLEELIEQGATIWHDDYGRICLDKNNYEICELVSLSNIHIGWVLWLEYEYNGEMHNTEVNIEELEEDVETAEWHYEMDCSREEKFQLPTWEEIKGKNFVITFCGKPKITDYFDAIWHTYDGRFRLNCCVEEKYISIYDDLPCEDYFDSPKKFPYTKDGYLSACRLAKKLFLGEK